MSGKNKGAKAPGCAKVKNACKYCLEQVTNKNGLQCQGACKKWAHFKCLNYTPGKIADIKAGLIKVTCPCPDCATTQQKEFLTNPPYTCSNHQCPANKSPKCESFDCPTNKKGRQLPIVDYPNVANCQNPDCTNEPITCPSSNPQSPRSATPPRAKKSKSPPASPKKGKKSRSKSPQCPDLCDVPGKKSAKKKQKSPKKSPSLSLMSSDASGCNNKCSPTSTSDSDLSSARAQASMVQALQEMCTTVGKLSVQLKELMCKMMQN